MEYNNQRMLQLPSVYAVLSEEEMTYTEGGAFSFNISQEQVMAFTLNLAVNALYTLGQGSVEYFATTIQNGLNDGLSLPGVLSHQWGKMNTWSKVAACGLAALGGYYVYLQVYSIVQSVKELVGAFKETFEMIKADQQANAFAQPTLLAV